MVVPTATGRFLRLEATQTCCMYDALAAGVDGYERILGVGIAEL